MMRKLYNEMIQEKAGIKGEPLVQIGGIKREKKQSVVSCQLSEQGATALTLAESCAARTAWVLR